MDNKLQSIETLPLEMLLEILEYLDLWAFQSMYHTSKKLHSTLFPQLDCLKKKYLALKDGKTSEPTSNNSSSSSSNITNAQQQTLEKFQEKPIVPTTNSSQSSSSTDNSQKQLLEKPNEVVGANIVKMCANSLTATQATFMSLELLKKLSLDQINEIACVSYRHASLVLRSRLFHFPPKEKKASPVATHQQKSNTDEIPFLDPTELKEFFKTISVESPILNICEHLIGFSTYMEFNLSSKTEALKKRLKQPDLIEDELNKIASGNGSYRVGATVVCGKSIGAMELCQSYIGRAISKKDPANIQLVANFAPYTFSKNQLREIAKLGKDYISTLFGAGLKKLENPSLAMDIARQGLDQAKTVLAYNLSRIRLRFDNLMELAKKDKEHSSLVISHIAAILNPLRVVNEKYKKDPALLKKIAYNLIDGHFWVQFIKQQEQIPPYKYVVDLERIVFGRPIRLISGIILLRLMSVSLETTQEILKIPNIKNFFLEEQLKHFAAQKSNIDSHYQSVIDEFLSSNTSSNKNQH
jgi:hypothetical protein